MLEKKYLEILQMDTIKQAEMKEKNEKKNILRGREKYSKPSIRQKISGKGKNT